MAIAFDSESEDLTGTATTSLSYSHTCTGSNLVLIVGVAINSGTEVITGVTYNSVAMTQINKIEDTGANSWEYLYGLIAPSTGANNVVVSLSSSTAVWSMAQSYTGVAQSGLPDAQGSHSTAGPSTSFTNSLTTVANNAWIVTLARNFAGNVTAGTNFTIRSSAFAIAMGDSNAAITPAGATNVTANSGSSSFWTMNLLSIAPFTGGGAGVTRLPYLNLMGVGQ